MQSSSQPLLAQTISNTISEWNQFNLGVNLVIRYLTTSMTWSDYKTLSCWLGCYGYESSQNRKLSDKDRPLLEYLVNNTTLDTLTIYHKLIFLGDINDRLKNSATQLLLSTNSSLLP